jgi:osmotically-inducible protein OsmY
MRPLVVALSAVLILVGVAGGCRTLTGKSLGENIDDKAITASVKTRLVRDRALNLTRVNVETNHGTVYLIGTVETPEQRARVEQLARQAGGVRDVVNQLQIEKR